ncbi:MAG: hypothetical protein ABEJ68_05825 [Halobacteriaceae archaeon]
MSETGASRVVVEFSPANDRTAAELDSESYRSYLRRTHSGRVSVGDEWTEFVSDGCGTSHGVTLRVTSVADGDAIDDETAFIFEPASA